MGKYRADMVLFNSMGVPLCVIECDGKAFHASKDKLAYDAKRDKAVKTGIGIATLRFTGSQINRDPIACVELIIKYLLTGEKPRRDWGKKKTTTVTKRRKRK
jgi:very-short-patch-repair endonuclease